MKTVTIQIGNSDDRLTQKRWSEFCVWVGRAVGVFSEQVHFAGGSPVSSPWQNHCWVVEVADPQPLRQELARLRLEYGQDSIAWTEGETEFI